MCRMTSQVRSECAVPAERLSPWNTQFLTSDKTLCCVCIHGHNNSACAYSVAKSSCLALGQAYAYLHQMLEQTNHIFTIFRQIGWYGTATK